MTGGYLPRTTGNYFDPSSIDRFRKFILTGNRDWLYPNDPSLRLLIFKSDKEWRDIFKRWEQQGKPYFNEEALESVRESNQQTSPKVPVKKKSTKYEEEIAPEAQLIIDKALNK